MLPPAERIDKQSMLKTDLGEHNFTMPIRDKQGLIRRATTVVEEGPWKSLEGIRATISWGHPSKGVDSQKEWGNNLECQQGVIYRIKNTCCYAIPSGSIDQGHRYSPTQLIRGWFTDPHRRLKPKGWQWDADISDTRIHPVSDVSMSSSLWWLNLSFQRKKYQTN